MACRFSARRRLAVVAASGAARRRAGAACRAAAARCRAAGAACRRTRSVRNGRGRSRGGAAQRVQASRRPRKWPRGAAATASAANFLAPAFPGVGGRDRVPRGGRDGPARAGRPPRLDGFAVEQAVTRGGQGQDGRGCGGSLGARRQRAGYPGDARPVADTPEAAAEAPPRATTRLASKAAVRAAVTPRSAAGSAVPVSQLPSDWARGRGRRRSPAPTTDKADAVGCSEGTGGGDAGGAGAQSGQPCGCVRQFLFLLRVSPSPGPSAGGTGRRAGWVCRGCCRARRRHGFRPGGQVTPVPGHRGCTRSLPAG